MSLIQFLVSKTFFKNFVLALVLAAIFIWAVLFYLDISTRHGEKIAVPKLEKLNIEEVESRLGEMNLRFEVVDSASYNPEFPPYSVVEQRPKAGDFVKENRKIYLTLNTSKYQAIPIPDVVGKTKRQVVSTLKASGFRIGEEEFIPDPGFEVVRGLKFGEQEISSGDLVPKFSVIDLVLGDGKG